MSRGDALGLVIAVGWILLIAALAVGALAFLAIVTRPAWSAVQGPVGRLVGRRVRARHGVALDAPRWACRACHSVNEAMTMTCYACGVAASEAGDPIPPTGADETWRPRVPPNRFDPSRYRGPGAPSPPGGQSPSVDGVPPSQDGAGPTPGEAHAGLPADAPHAASPPTDVAHADEPTPGPTIGK